MINNIEDFKKKYPNAAVVNYDISDLHGYGLSYRTSSERIEIFRKDNGKYLEYPNIQLYSTLTSGNYNIFIIKDNKMYELGISDKPNCFKKVREVNDIDINIFTDIFYASKKRHKKSANVKDESIYRIED